MFAPLIKYNKNITAEDIKLLSDFTIKADGDSVDAKIIRKNFKKQVIPFIVLMKSWLKGKIK